MFEVISGVCCFFLAASLLWTRVNLPLEFNLSYDSTVLEFSLSSFLNLFLIYILLRSGNSLEMSEKSVPKIYRLL